MEIIIRSECTSIKLLQDNTERATITFLRPEIDERIEPEKDLKFELTGGEKGFFKLGKKYDIVISETS